MAKLKSLIQPFITGKHPNIGEVKIQKGEYVHYLRGNFRVGSRSEIRELEKPSLICASLLSGQLLFQVEVPGDLSFLFIILIYIGKI